MTAQTTRRVVTTTQVQIQEIPTEESITELVFDETMPIPSEVVVEEVEKPVPTVQEIVKPAPVAVPKAKKPTSRWEAPEDLEIVFEKVIETKTTTVEKVKPEEMVTEEVEPLPTYAASTAQLSLYETTKPVVSMTFKVPEELKPEGNVEFFGMRY